MIFIFADDRTLMVVNNVADVQMNCESIDVQNGVYQFFDEKGNYLEPSFILPNKQLKTIGPVGWVVSGKYLLKPSKIPDAPRMLTLLEGKLLLEDNVFFKSINEIKEYLTIHSS